MTLPCLAVRAQAASFPYGGTLVVAFLLFGKEVVAKRRDKQAGLQRSQMRETKRRRAKVGRSRKILKKHQWFFFIIFFFNFLFRIRPFLSFFFIRICTFLFSVLRIMNANANFFLFLCI